MPLKSKKLYSGAHRFKPLELNQEFKENQNKFLFHNSNFLCQISLYVSILMQNITKLLKCIFNEKFKRPPPKLPDHLSLAFLINLLSY